MKEIDARKLACPTPVLMVKEALESHEPDAVKVIVDNEAAKQNVSRFLASQSYETQVENTGDGFHVTGRKSGDAKSKAPEISCELEGQSAAAAKILVMITTDRMGYGDDALGKKLMINYINTIKELGEDLWRLVFVNNGVKLAIEGAEVIETLQNLEAVGIRIMVCGTCLDHFNLFEKKQVGETTNMLDIVTAMHLADKVINL